MSHAAKLWAGTVVSVLALDAVLVRAGRETMSEWYGRNWWKLAPVAVYLGCHLHSRPRWMARYDPLSLAARRLVRPVVVLPHVVSSEDLTSGTAHVLVIP